MPVQIPLALMLAAVQPVPIPMPAPAQATSEPQELDAVQVSAAQYDARRDASTTRQVYDQQTLRAHGDPDLADALRRLPGITITPAAAGQPAGVALRGLGAGYTQILIDGQPPAAGMTLQSLTPDMVERVEILRAPTADMRAGGIAGTINIVLAPTAVKEGRRLTASWNGGAGGRTPSLAWRASRALGPHTLGLDATASRRTFKVEETGTEQARTTDGTLRTDRTTALQARGHRDTVALKPSLDLQVTDDARLTLQGLLDAGRFRRVIDIDWRTLQGDPLRTPRYRQATRTDVDQAQLTAAWNQAFAAGGGLTARMSAGGNREDYRFTEQGKDHAGKDTLDDHTRARLDVSSISASNRLTLPAIGRHQLEIGWDAGRDRRGEARTQQLDDLLDGTTSYSDLSFDARIDRLAVYMQDELALGPRWSLYVGGRWERMRTHSMGTGFTAFRHEDDVFSPILQSRWTLPGSTDHQVRLSFSRSWRAPTLAQLIPRPYTSTNNRALNPDEQGNPALRPELSTGVDAAYEAQWDNGMQLNLGAHARKIDGVIQTRTTQQGDRWVASPLNAGRALTWGLEMDGTVDVARLLEHAPALTVRMSAAANWSRVDDVPGPDNRLAEQVPWTATIELDRVLNPRWSTSLRYSVQAGGYSRQSWQEASITGWRRDLDAFVRWTPSRAMSVRLGLVNLLQRDTLSGDDHDDGGVHQTLRRARTSPMEARLQIEWTGEPPQRARGSARSH